MDSPGYGIEAMRRGSYDDALRPHLRHLAQRRRSAPSLVFGKTLGIPWSPIREEEASPGWVSVEQSPFVFGLAGENGELLLDQQVQVTDGTKTRERHLFLFSEVIVFAKFNRSSGSYRLKDSVRLEDAWIHDFQDEEQGEEEEEGTAGGGDVDLRVTIVLAWTLKFCLVSFGSPEVKDRWLQALHRRIAAARARSSCVLPSPHVLMKLLSGNVATKALTGGGMEELIDFPLDGDVKSSVPPRESSNEEEKPTHPSEKKWNQVVRKLRKGSSFISRSRPETDSDSKTQLFGQTLCRICPDDCSLPKPVAEMLLLLRRRGPSTEGVFRKPCNSKNMKDVREQLNSGLEVELERHPVGLIVGLLKSFLKELPGSLLVSDLYDNWMEALDREDSPQRSVELRKVADKLPGHNRLLLRHLLCVLHHILQSADVNKMDAHNLAVCIGPTLLQLDAVPLDEQKDKMAKVTELTQVLIEHCDIIGENIPNLLDTDDIDSVSSQHHDSAYDSTDPDGDGEAGESISSACEGCGSSSSLSPCTSTSNASWSSETAYKPKLPYNRRCSEPIILVSPDLVALCSHARSHEDCSAERDGFQELPLKKQISDDSFLLKRRGGRRHVLSFPKLGNSTMDPLAYMAGYRVKDCSSSSLESAASNQSEGSVFTSSPVGSPACQRRSTNQPSTKSQQDIPKPITDDMRRSQSMRVASKVLMRTRSLGAFGRNSLKKDSQKENSFPCETLQEDAPSEADPPAQPMLRPRPLSAIEVFRQVDSRLPCRPPSYEHAVQNMVPPPQYGAMTVQDAIELERRSRPSSVNYDIPSACSVGPYAECFDQANDVRRPFRQRAMSESATRGRHEVVSRRCSQPVFEEFSYAKESYV